MSRKKQTADFLFLLCCYLKANPGCLAEVSNPGAVSAQSPLLGYFDATCTETALRFSEAEMH